MLIQAKLTMILWAETLNKSSYQVNLSPYTAIECKKPLDV